MKLGKYLRDPGRIARKLRWQMLYNGEPRDVTVASLQEANSLRGSRIVAGQTLKIPSS